MSHSHLSAGDFGAYREIRTDKEGAPTPRSSIGIATAPEKETRHERSVMRARHTGLVPVLVSVLIAWSGVAAAQNLVRNGGFTGDLSGWNVRNDALSNAAWASPDAAGSGSSGSVFITDTSDAGGTLNVPLAQCIQVLPGAQYALGSKFFIPSGQGTSGFAETEVFWLSSESDVSCNGGYITADAIMVFSQNVAADTWLPLTKTVTAPPGAVRAWLATGVGRNEASGTLSANIDDISLAPVTGPAGVLVGVLAGAGSLHGANGANFKTAFQATNWGSLAIDVGLVFHPAGQAASPGDPRLSTHILPGQTVSTDDVVAAFGRSGLGSIDVYSTEGRSAPVVLARVFNDGGEAGTTGFVEDMIDPSLVPGGPGVSVAGVLLGPSDVSRFRYNIGIRTLANPVSVSIVVKDSAGNTVQSHVETYPAEYYTQKSASDFLGGFDLGDDDSIFIFFSGGGAIIYGATTDDVTNDPSVQFLPYLGAIA